MKSTLQLLHSDAAGASHIGVMLSCLLSAQPQFSLHATSLYHVPVQDSSIIGTIEDFMWLKLHMVQPSTSSAISSASRLSPTSSSNLLSPTYTMTALQDEVLHWGPNFFSQNGAQPLVYVVVLLMSQHFRHAVEYMGSQTQLKDHGTHLAIACNHLKVGLECCILCCVDEQT